MKNGMELSCHALEKLFFGVLVIGEDHGACGMFSGNLNCSRNLGVTPFATIFFNILTEFSPLNKAVRMIVMTIETFFLPFSVMDKCCIRQRLLQRLVQRLSLFGNMVVKADQRSEGQAQVPKTLQSQPRTVIRGFNLVSHERCFSSDVSTNESVGNFVFKVGLIVFKFLDASLKFHGLPVGNVHGKFEFSNSTTKVFPFRQNSVRSFAVEKYAKVSKRTIEIFYMLPAIAGLSVLPGHFMQQINISMIVFIDTLPTAIKKNGRFYLKKKQQNF
ncbi:MAG: hypothetical protein PHV82_16620 [Victivallaceae bacterium]|nr:hypothetical protein [Victivallaceae bacterium]